LQSYENSHADALHPASNTGHDPGFFGEYNEAAPVTVGEVRELKRSVDAKMDSLPTTQSYPERRVASKTLRTATAPYLPRAASVSSSHSASISTDNIDSMEVSVNKPSKGCRIAPLPRVKIPPIKAGPYAWKEAIKQWEEGDAMKGFKALKDWPKEWYTGAMRPFTGSLWREREATSMIRLGRDDKVFEEAYPEIKKNQGSLLRAIRRKNPDIAKAQTSKNGTPEEREARRCTNDDDGMSSEEV